MSRNESKDACDETSQRELRELLSVLHREYGVDFRGYTRNTVLRRLSNLVHHEGLSGLPELRRRLLQNGGFLHRVMSALSVNVTTMFRDPPFFAALREHVLPELRRLPFIRAWHAGCSSGEEVYSLAILLHEENLYERARIYATDMNPSVLERARQGIYSMAQVREFTENHRRSGGTRPLSHFYVDGFGHAAFDRQLRRNVVFAQHNLASDASFQEFNLILCRNVLIYFDSELQARVHGLLLRSLAPGGFLGLGKGETVQFQPVQEEYEEVVRNQPLFRRRDSTT